MTRHIPRLRALITGAFTMLSAGDISGHRPRGAAKTLRIQRVAATAKGLILPWMVFVSTFLIFTCAPEMIAPGMSFTNPVTDAEDWRPKAVPVESRMQSVTWSFPRMDFRGKPSHHSS